MGWVCEGAEWHSHAAEPQVHQSTTVDCCQQSFAMLRGFYFVVLGSWPHSMSLTRPKVCLLFSASQPRRRWQFRIIGWKLWNATRRDEPIAGSSLRWHLHFTRCLVNSNELSLFSSLHWEKCHYIFFFYGSLFLMRSGISVSTCSLASLSAARPTVRPQAKIRSSWDRTARLPFTGELNCKRSSHLVNNLLHLIVSATNYSIPVECWKEIGTQNPIQMQMETTRMATRSQRRPAGRSTGLT